MNKQKFNMKFLKTFENITTAFDDDRYFIKAKKLTYSAFIKQ